MGAYSSVSPSTNTGLAKVNQPSFQETFQPHHIYPSPSDFNQTTTNSACSQHTGILVLQCEEEDQACLDPKSQMALFYLHTHQNLKVNMIPSVSLLCFSQCQFLITVIYLLLTTVTIMCTVPTNIN